MSQLGGIDYAADQMQAPQVNVMQPRVVQAAPPVVQLAAGDAKLYKSNMASWKFIFKTGMVAHFIDYKFATDNPHQIAELDAEISYGHPNILFDKDEPTMKSAEMQLMENLRQKFYREFQAEQDAKAVDPNRAMGSSVQGTINAASTRDIADVAAGQGPASGGVKFIPATVAPK